MNYTKQKIFNLALKNLKVSVPISASNSTEKNYSVLDEYYDTAKLQVLEATEWAFANCYKKLNLLQDKPLNPCYEFAYDYPNDVACPRLIVVGQNEKQEHFEVASVDKKLQLWTNRENATLKYTKNDVTESEFNASFAIALSWYLAFLACPTIAGARATQSDCMTIYKEQIQQAEITNANTDYPVDESVCNWLDVR